jgi:hypothetical protein
MGSSSVCLRRIGDQANSVSHGFYFDETGQHLWGVYHVSDWDDGGPRSKHRRIANDFVEFLEMLVACKGNPNTDVADANG